MRAGSLQFRRLLRRAPEQQEWWGGGAGQDITLAAVVTGTVAGPMTGPSFIHDSVATSA